LLGAGAIVRPGRLGADKPSAAFSASDWLSLPNWPVSPFDVGNRAQLFVDNVLVRETERVTVTPHPAEKHPKNPLMRADRPWEGWMIALYGSVMYDQEDKIFKMWY
jgi:hypothetical protein